MTERRIPRVSEASFRKDYSLMWTITGAGCLILGLVVGPRVVHARGSWLTDVVAILVYLFSLLLCRVVLLAIWRRPHALPPVLFFSIPVGALCLAAVLLMRWLGPNLQIGGRTVFVFAFTMGLLYAAALVWGIGVGIRRKKMGQFEVDVRR
ncbi:MAG: hypothetical protein ACXVZX_09955 [Terriglobales bacterium]